MNRRTWLKLFGLAALLPTWVQRVRAATGFRRRRLADTEWPSQTAWQRLNDAVGGNLISVGDPFAPLKTDPTGAEAKLLLEGLKNPYYIGDAPGLTQTLGWVDAWTTAPSVYAVVARN